MGVSKASAKWVGGLKTGQGTMKPAHAGEVGFSAASRFEGQPASNPEELIGAALSGCFSMALTAGLEKAGLSPQSVATTADVTIEKLADGFSITGIELSTEATVPGADPTQFQTIAEATKKGCPVGKALASVPIKLSARLTG
jgi:osmotically inducible protein OsmC